MSTQQILPQNGLRVGEQIVAEGDNVSLGNDVGVKRNLTVGGSVFTNRVITPSVSKEHNAVEAIIIDCAYTDHRILLRSNALGFKFINVPSRDEGTFRVKVYTVQDTVGNRTIDFSANSLASYPYITWTNIGTSAGTPIYPVLQTINGRVDVFEFITFDGGVNWVACQINPVTVQYTTFNDVLYALGTSVSGTPPALPASYPGPAQIPNFNGTVVQVKQSLSTAFTDFTALAYTDLLTMVFTPKYKNSKLLLMANLHHGTNASNDFSAHFMFTIGTNPITGANILSTSGQTNTTANQAQNCHFGGYFNGVDAGNNNVWHPNGSITFAHGFDAGFNIDLRIRGRTAAAWAGRNLILNRSWGAPDTAYTVYNTSSFTVMEILA